MELRWLKGADILRDDKLYSRLICVLTLGELLYRDKISKLEQIEDLRLVFDLMNKLDPEDVHDITIDFMQWYKHKGRFEKEE